MCGYIDLGFGEGVCVVVGGCVIDGFGFFVELMVLVDMM